jgi:hypothetical protein
MRAVEERKRVLAKLLRKSSWALQLNEHIVESGDIVFRHACKLGYEGIVSKRLGSPYISGRSRNWVKSKNPAAPAVKREEEEMGQTTMTLAEYVMLKMKTVLPAMLLAFRSRPRPRRPRTTTPAAITWGKPHGTATPRRSTIPGAALSAPLSPPGIRPASLVVMVPSRAP